MCFHAYGKNLTADEVEYVRSDIDEMLAAFEEGDATVLIAKTHSSLYPLVGGKESFKQLTIDALAQLKATGIKFLSSELKSPTVLYTAGEEEICFVPRISVMEIEGTKMQSVGFMIAIRKIDSGSWSYLDGTGFNSDRISTLSCRLCTGLPGAPSRVTSTSALVASHSHIPVL